MNEDFVTYEIAKKLKKKGFKKKCLAHYDCCGVLLPSTYIETWDANNCEDLDYTFFLRSFNEGLLDTIGIVYDAPTISQVLKWLREEKNIYTEIFLYNGKYSPLIKSITQICKDDYFHKCFNEDAAYEEYDTYEQAALAGIEYTLDNLI